MLRNLIEQRASIGQTWHVSQVPPGSIVRGYGDTYAGEDVDPEIALSVAAWVAGTRILGEGVSSLPLILYRRLPNGGKERAVDHPYYTLMHDIWNPEHTSMESRELLQNSLVLCGNGYAQKITNGAGRIAELWPLRADRMRVERVSGRRVYHYTKASGGRRDFSADEILHIPGFGYDGLVGYSLVYLARHALALSIALEKYGSKFFANGAWPGIILEHPKRLSKEAHGNLVDSFTETHGGADQSHGVFVAEEGMKAVATDINPQNSQT
jgi:HK97 family phage portal protein